MPMSVDARSWMPARWPLKVGCVCGSPASHAATVMDVPLAMWMAWGATTGGPSKVVASVGG